MSSNAMMVLALVAAALVGTLRAQPATSPATTSTAKTTTSDEVIEKCLDGCYFRGQCYPPFSEWAEYSDSACVKYTCVGDEDGGPAKGVGAVTCPSLRPPKGKEDSFKLVPGDKDAVYPACCPHYVHVKKN